MATVYVLLRSGVYINGIGGVFSDKEIAKNALDDYKKSEPDDWHSWSCVPYEINEKIAREGDGLSARVCGNRGGYALGSGNLASPAEIDLSTEEGKQC